MEAARVAYTGDLARLAELVQMAMTEAAGRRGGSMLVAEWLTADEDELRDGLAAAMVRSDSRLWVGTIDGAVVGVALAEAEPAGMGRIPLIFVEPDGRGVGVGEALLEEASTWLAGHGCRTIDVTVLPGDRDTKQFFEGAGMVARLLVMSRSL